MFLVTHPEVLADDWLPPVALGREGATRELVRLLDPPSPRAPPPWIASVAGPSGSGSSTVARRAAREVADRLREAGVGPARLLAVRTGLLKGPHGVATALLRRFDEGFDGRGFPTSEILAGVLRRLRRDRRPAVVVLDDIAVGGADVGPVVRALADPDRFLPEGESGLPGLYTVLAGTPEGLAPALAALGPSVSARPSVRLAPYDEPTLRAIAKERAARALGRDAPESLVRGVVAQTVADGGGARRAFELLRRELLGGGADPVRRRGISGGGAVPVEAHVVDAIGLASHGTFARLGEVRRREAELAKREGRPPLPTTTLWRRIVRLERAGYLRREIRTGGPGGTLSVLRVLTPLEEWVTEARGGTRPAAGAATTSSETLPSWPGPAARESWPPPSRP